MATLRDIKRRMAAVASTAKITQAMRMVSSAKLKRAQDAILNARPYSMLLKTNLEKLIDSVGDDYFHPLLEKREKIENICLVVITSDRGLCGSFNSNLIRFVSRYIETELIKNYPNAKLSMIRIGKRGISGIKLQNINYLKNISGISGRIDYNVIDELAKILIDGYIEEKFDKVIFFFNEFKNILIQVPKSFNFLPFEKQSTVESYFKGKAKEFETKHEAKKEKNLLYIFEPDPKSILDNLIPLYVKNQILRILLESNAAEHAARRMAMENATNNAKDLMRHLELVYNKERQASITKEMLEIVSGANALKSQ
ncbi:ATP synthase F1 subunit gamma [Bacteroidetes/Chlorobi group bacterium Naka2016]|jgi:F-type H+-transporting ATPase subunit gamma|nr:MAG: ATP synthase F1 subunit gamma [Bacteroidetes/Chlorobi group bacterium Naka2016]